MSLNRVRVATVVGAFVAASVLGSCGGSGEDGPTTQSVDEYASTQAAKASEASGTPSGTSSAPPSGTASATASGSGSTSSGSGSGSSSASKSTVTDDLPGVIKDKKVTEPAIKFVNKYVSTLNASLRDPDKLKDLDSLIGEGCAACKDHRATVVSLKNADRRLQGTPVEFTVTEVKTADQSGMIRVFGMLDQRSVSMVDPKGKVTSRTKDTPADEVAFFVNDAPMDRKVHAVKAVVG